MARFKRSGWAWDGQKWKTPASLNALLDEIEEWQPFSRSLDGTVASKTHDQNNPSSDHSPKPSTGTGIVRAVDVGESEPEGDVLAEALRASKDPRIKYVIHEKRIFSSYNHVNGPAWSWRKYSGYNDHMTHVHVSLNSSKDADGSAWDLGLGGEDVKELILSDQKALNAGGFKGANGKVLTEDGILGPNTQFAKESRDKAAAAKVAGTDAVARAEAKRANDRLDNV